jgi:hypothetical protein
MGALSGREIILEFRVSGQYGQVSAIDVASGIEVAVTVPSHAAKADREALAIRKLTRALIDASIVEGRDGVTPRDASTAKGGNPIGSPPIISKRGILI